MSNEWKYRLWVVAGVIMILPLTQFSRIIELEWFAIQALVDLFRPSAWGLIILFYYWPIMGFLSAWYWWWRFLRLLGSDGPLPWFRNILIVLWAPVWILPVTVLACGFGWLACWSLAASTLEDLDAS